MDTPDVSPTITQNVANQPEQQRRAISAPLLFFYVLGDVLGSVNHAPCPVLVTR